MAKSTQRFVSGTLAYRRWLTTVRFAHPAHQIVLQDYIHAFQEAEARLSDYTADLAAAAKLVDGPARRRCASDAGITLVVAVSEPRAELGDFRRFAHTRQLMA
jgi:transposase